MVKEIAFFFRHGPSVGRKQARMGPVEFQNWLAAEADKDGFAELRSALVEGLRGDVLEVGAGTGAMFGYYGSEVHVTALEPDDDFRAGAEKAASTAPAAIEVVPGAGESLPFDDARFDAIVTSVVLCSVQSMAQTLGEFMRVLRPGGELRMLEHVRSDHWLAGPLMNLSNPVWLRINKVGCNWNRRIVEAVRDAGFAITSIQNHKVYSPASPAAFPLRLMMATKELESVN